jgi:hypothetical protein
MGGMVNIFALFLEIGDRGIQGNNPAIIDDPACADLQSAGSGMPS